jgi:hypothetical protein
MVNPSASEMVGSGEESAMVAVPRVLSKRIVSFPDPVTQSVKVCASLFALVIASGREHLPSEVVLSSFVVTVMMLSANTGSGYKMLISSKNITIGILGDVSEKYVIFNIKFS